MLELQLTTGSQLILVCFFTCIFSSGLASRLTSLWSKLTKQQTKGIKAPGLLHLLAALQLRWGSAAVKAEKADGFTADQVGREARRPELNWSLAATCRGSAVA